MSSVDNYRILPVNRASCRPIRSVIMQVINKIGRPRSGSLICLITSMITDRIRRSLLRIYHHSERKNTFEIEGFTNIDQGVFSHNKEPNKEKKIFSQLTRHSFSFKSNGHRVFYRI